MKGDFNCMSTVNFQMFKLDLGKTEEPVIKLPTFIGAQKKSREFQKKKKKKKLLASLTTLNPLIV